MNKESYNPQEFIDVLLSLNFNIQIKKKTGRPFYISDINEWGSNDDKDFWNFSIEINGYEIDSLISNYHKIKYNLFLDSFLQKYKQYFKNLFENNVFQGSVDSLKNYIEDLKNLNGNFKNKKAVDWENLAFKHDIITHFKTSLIIDDFKKLEEDSNFFLVCISEFLNQHQSIIKSTLSFTENLLEITKNSVMENNTNSFKANSILTWNKTDTDLLELIISLIESGAIQNDSKTLTHKEAFSAFSDIFNKEIKDPYKKLNAARNRKKEEITPFLIKLQGTLEEYYKKQD